MHFWAALPIVPFHNSLGASHLGRGFQGVALRSRPLPPSLCGLLPEDFRFLLPEFPSPTQQTSRDLPGVLRSRRVHPEGCDPVPSGRSEFGFRRLPRRPAPGPGRHVAAAPAPRAVRGGGRTWPRRRDRCPAPDACRPARP